MTISYKPKHPKIETEEYKRTGNMQKGNINPEKQKKIDYEKMMERFRTDVKKFEAEKEEFAKEATRLRFKKELLSQLENPLLVVQENKENSQACQNISSRDVIKPSNTN